LTTGNHLEYAGHWETIYTIPGNIPMRKWKRHMPRIPKKHLDCTIYLYPDDTAARRGVSYGGSGFLIAIPFEENIEGTAPRSHVYAVTNHHVINPDFGKSPVIRLNTMEGDTEIIPLTYDDWIHDWTEDDLALYMLDDTQMYRFSWYAQMPGGFITDKDVEQGLIDIGTDTITIGRFIGFDGEQQNLPVVRFGNVAAANTHKVKHEIVPKMMQESLLIESRTIPGTSGSPVFNTILVPGHPDFAIPRKLLGIVWGYSHNDIPIYRKKRRQLMKEIIARDNTGMSLVIPAWRLLNFLDRSDLVDDRKRIEQQAIEDAENSTGGASPAAAVPDDDDNENLNFTEEDF
jgi:hypothetical protein